MRKSITLLYVNGGSLYNDNRVLINPFIKSGRTELFDNEIKAYAYAQEINSYHYDVYNSQGRSVGFAVTK